MLMPLAAEVTRMSTSPGSSAFMGRARQFLALLALVAAIWAGDSSAQATEPPPNPSGESIGVSPSTEDGPVRLLRPSARPSAAPTRTGAAVETSQEARATREQGQLAPRTAPPAAVTEFQRFVADTTGRQLPLFGYDLFDAAAFPSLTNVPVPADYVVGPGDEILLRLWGGVEADLRITVDRSGLVSLPRIGTFRVAGVRVSELEPTFRNEVAKTFRKFEISVNLGQLRAIQVFVVGQARRPGTYLVSSLSTLLSALFEVGGPASTGSMRAIQLKRDGRVVTTLDLYRFIVEGDKSADVRLAPGDVIVVPPAGPRIALQGSIDKPAILELNGTGEPLEQILRYHGNLRALTSTHKVLVERIDSAARNAPRQVQERSLDSTGLAEMLRDGDIVTLFKISPQFSNAVTLRGNVAAPLRYAFKPGMRISDLIPEREALVQPDYYSRKNMLVQHESGNSVTADRVLSDMRNLLSEINWDYAVVQRLDSQNVRSRLLPFNLGKAVVDRAEEHDLLLQPGDVVTIFGVADIPVPRHRITRLVRVAGEVNAAGIYQIDAGETLRSLLRRAGGATPQAYLFGIEFARESTRARQRAALQDALRRLESTTANAAAAKSAELAGTDPAAASRILATQEQARASQLARLRSMEPSGRIALELTPEISSIDLLPDLPLEDGDSILVPAAPGFVYVVGAVANSSALLWRDGRTVKQYLLAAGVEPSADEDNLFIVRADGSIVHRRDKGWLFSTFESMTLAQGDTLVVPERLVGETAWGSFVRGFKDWTQILANLGLTAAAINSLGR